MFAEYIERFFMLCYNIVKWQPPTPIALIILCVHFFSLFVTRISLQLYWMKCFIFGLSFKKIGALCNVYCVQTCKQCHAKCLSIKLSIFYRLAMMLNKLNVSIRIKRIDKSERADALDEGS